MGEAKGDKSGIHDLIDLLRMERRHGGDTASVSDRPDRCEGRSPQWEVDIRPPWRRAFADRDRTLSRSPTSGPSGTREGYLDLVGKAAKGDHASFEALVDLHLAGLHRLALVVAGPDRADDVTQEAFLRAWQQLPRLRDSDRFLPWLRRILVNVSRDSVRSDRRRVRAMDLTDATTATETRSGFRDPALDIDPATDLHRALAHLTIDQRAVFGLHYLADLTLPEVAATLGLPVGTAKSRLNAGLVALRRHLTARP
jgi:RNA polymerase sigma factor (sigma-70 family)